MEKRGSSKTATSNSASDEYQEAVSDTEDEVVVVEGIETGVIDEESEVKLRDPSDAPRRIELLPADFFFGSTLGEGAFARVVHAKSKKNGTEFAIKIMEKRHIKKENKVKHVMMERRVLTMVSHPLIVKFHFSFQDPGYLFMCMELVPGGILSDLIFNQTDENSAVGRVDVGCDLHTSQFYIAEIVMALEYLHGLGIIHRDLKPENILIGESGHIKITDFGTAAICSDNQSPRTSFVGTQDYVSPEVLSGESTATKACDLWAVGCITYQMLSGRSPFHAATEFLTFELIMGHCRNERALEFPVSINTNARDLISHLLRPKEDERLGAGEDFSGNGYDSLKVHAFFDGIDWDNLLSTTRPPYIPNQSKFPRAENMRDGATNDWLLEGDPTPITPYFRMSAENNAATKPSSRATSSANLVWNKFLKEGENQVFTSVISKRVGLFSKKRQLILTDAPRLVYVDPDSMEIKGEIPWTTSQPVSCTVRSIKDFDVTCAVSKRVYHLSDVVVGANAWADQINNMLVRQRRSSLSS